MLFNYSSSLDVFTNLAIEDFLIALAPDAPPTLFLWRSTPAVVIGKHQNPWRECRLRDMRAAGVKLARRISGGGAVYHDEGNLNYAFFTRRAVYRQDAVFDAVLHALTSLKLDAYRMGKSSLGIEGRKFSGNAFCYRRDAVLHHGTLLLDADLGALAVMLKGTDDTYATHAVASEPAAVINLTECNPGLTSARLSEALVMSFECYTDQAAEPLELQPEGNGISKRIAEMRSTAWRYDRTPTFSVTMETRSGHAPIRLELAVREGHIEQIHVSAPEGIASFLNGVRPILAGKRLGGESVTRDLRDAVMKIPSATEKAVGQWLIQRLATFTPFQDP